MRKILTIVAIVALSGCASSVYWNFPSGGTDQQFRQDDYACIQESQQQTSSAYVGPYGGNAQSYTAPNKQLYKSCMYARGYREGRKP